MSAEPQLWAWTIQGVDGNGRTWHTSGAMVCNISETPSHLIEHALQEAFQALTHGRAEYGNPGKGGCRGPYTITKLVWEAIH